MSASPARSLLLLCCLALAGLGLQLALGAGQLQRLAANPSWHHADSSAPLLTNLDGFYYLRQAERIAQGRYLAEDPLRWLPGPQSPPALSCTLRAFSAGLGFPDLQRAAMWLPAVLGGLLGLPLVLWGRRLSARHPIPGALAALAFGMLSPAWIMAAGAGRLDTTPLPPVLLLLGGWFVLRLLEDEATPGGMLRRAAPCLGIGLCVALLGWWWPPGLALAALWLPAVGVLLLRGLGRRGRGLALLAATLLAGLGAGAALVLRPEALGWLVAHLELLAKGGGAGEVARGIAELRAPGALQLLRLTAGSVAAGIAALAGLGLLLWRTPRSALALAPLLAAGAVAFWAERFGAFAAPVLALGLATLALAPLELDALERLSRPLRAGLAVVLCAALLFPCARFGLGYTPRPEVTRWMDALALELRDAARENRAGLGQDTLVWSWWDWGYYLQWRTGLRTLFDGGSQGAGTSFVAAWPLASADDAAAARWMRFFAAHGPGMYHWLGRRLDSQEEALELLEQAMLHPSRLEAEARARRFSRLDLEAFFHPHASVYLFLPVEFLGLSNHWLGLAGAAGAPPAGFVAHIDCFLKQGFALKQSDVRENRSFTGVLGPQALEKGLPPQLPGFDLDEGRLPRDMAADAGPTLMLSEDSPLACVADGPGARSLAFRLLEPADPRPEGFAALTWRPGIGGVWQVRERPQN